jgi:hypothetical protein
MTTEPESTQPAVPATFKRTELQRYPSPASLEATAPLVSCSGNPSGASSPPPRREDRGAFAVIAHIAGKLNQKG